MVGSRAGVRRQPEACSAETPRVNVPRRPFRYQTLDASAAVATAAAASATEMSARAAVRMRAR